MTFGFGNNMEFSHNKRGQVAIFIIMALVIVASIVIFFVIRESGLIGAEIPQDFQNVFDFYESCIGEEVEIAADITGSQGGRIFVDDYIPGSQFAPFGNQLNFLGFPVPYWYSLSGNGVISENVPSKREMERDIERYIEENVDNCDFQEFYERGFYIKLGSPEVSVDVLDNSIDVNLKSSVLVSRGDGAARRTEFNVEVPSKLGRFYDTAIEVYAEQRDEAFLENYSADILRLYAPVDGVELSCSGRIWKTREVVDEIYSGLEANINSIRANGNYFVLSDEKREYFVIERSVDNPVGFLYSRDWPSRIEIDGVDGELMIAEPIGNQQGLGILGFCYAPYHFVYDLSFPVMIQVYDGEELFQFPVVVIIDKNVPRQGFVSEFSEPGEPDFNFCEFKTQDVEINVFDINLNRVEANISYGCFNQRCLLGETSGGVFRGVVPSCLNGELLVRSEGYTEKTQVFSSNEETFADVILDREYETKIELIVGGEPLKGNAIVTFEGERSRSAALPAVDSILLSEGLYNVSVFVYGNSSITIPESTKTQCTEVPKSGVLGLFGGTREECFIITLPETKLESALIGGGRTSDVFIFDSELARRETLILNVDRLPTPDSLEDLQFNYIAFDGSRVEVGFE